MAREDAEREKREMEARLEAFQKEMEAAREGTYVYIVYIMCVCARYS